MSGLSRTAKHSQTLDQDGFERDCAAWVATARAARAYHGNHKKWREGLAFFVHQNLVHQERIEPLCVVEPTGIDTERVTISARHMAPVIIPLDMSGPSYFDDRSS